MYYLRFESNGLIWYTNKKHYVAYFFLQFLCMIQLASLLRKGLNLEVLNEVKLRLQQVSSHAQPLHGQILGSQLKIDFYVVDCDIWHLPMTPQHACCNQLEAPGDPGHGSRASGFPAITLIS